jgi:type IV pilus assembly protein PilM
MASLLPKSIRQVRPRIAVEVRPEGVYAARANDVSGVLAQVSTAALPAGTVVPSLHQGNVTDRIALIAALKRTLGAVQLGRNRDVTLIVPDSSVRVLLLDFDELPSKADDILPVIRFRLVKLLPFPPDAAQISYQAMSRHALVLQVLVVAIPNEVLAEYESAVREAGFEPGAVLPSTLAVAAAVDDAGQTASLLVNGGEFAVTTAILRRGEVLLHRTLELRADPMAEAAAAVALEPINVALAAEAGAESDVAVAEMVQAGVLSDAPDPELAELELLQAISVAAAYYEDSLAVAPDEMIVAGTLDAQALESMLAVTGMRARGILQASDLLASTTVPLGVLAGLRGVLKS